MSYQAMKRNLKCILTSERSECEKAIFCLIPTIWYSGKGKAMGTVKRSVVARGCTGAGLNTQSTENFSVNENILYDTINDRYESL